MKSKEDNLEELVRFDPVPFKEFCAQEFPEANWLVDKLIPAASSIILSGRSTGGKTWTSLEIAIKVATGGMVFDHLQAYKTKVLLINEEDNPRTFIKKMSSLTDINQDLGIEILSRKNIILDTKEGVEKLKDLCLKKGIGLVIIDSFTRVHNLDENSASDIKNLFRQMTKITNEGISIILIDHTRKRGVMKLKDEVDFQETLRGSSDKLAAVDVHIAIDRQQDSQGEYVVICPTKSREDFKLPMFEVGMVAAGEGVKLVYRGEHDENQSKADKAREEILEVMQKEDRPMWKDELKDLIGRGDSAITQALKDVVNRGELTTKTVKEMRQDGFGKHILQDNGGKISSSRKYYWWPDRFGSNDISAPITRNEINATELFRGV